MTTGLVWHESYMWHDTGSGAAFLEPGGFLQPGEHVESPGSKRRLKNLLDISGTLEQLTSIEPRLASRTELERVHDPEYIDRLELESAVHGGYAGDEAPFGPGGFEIASRSAGGCIAAVEAVADGRVDNAYALVRPPGHHAMAESGFGFCIFNNGAIAARHLIGELGFSRVAIVDWDAHHGNGAQALFYEDPTVMTISIHQDSAFPPSSGRWQETGEAEGAGTNLNLPMPPGCGAGAYLACTQRVIIPALEKFEPDFLIVACGFDAGPQDPLARMMVHSDGFRQMAAMVREFSEARCGGRLVMVHEGGYSKAYVPFCGLAVIEAMSGIDSGVYDPFLTGYQRLGGQDLQPHQEAVITRAEKQLNQIPGA